MKCYISRTFDTDLKILNILYQALDNQNINRIDSFDEIVISGNITDNLINNITAADFVIAVLTKESPNIIFELGVAAGVKKPIFMVIGEGLQVPFNLSDVTIIRINNNLSENIDFPLKHFVGSLKKDKSTNKKEKSDKQYNSNLSNKLLIDLENVRKNGNGLDFENFVDKFFKSLSNQYATSSGLKTKDDGYDYALWIDELEGIICNPILFEFKFGNINDNFIEKSVLKLLHHTSNSSQIAFILYCDKNKKKVLSTSTSIPIIAVDIEVFMLKVFESNLSKAILYFRNSIAHGKEL